MNWIFLGLRTNRSSPQEKVVDISMKWLNVTVISVLTSENFPDLLFFLILFSSCVVDAELATEGQARWYEVNNCGKENTGVSEIRSVMALRLLIKREGITETGRSFEVYYYLHQTFASSALERSIF